MTATLGYQLDRIITIRATRETVFGFFTDSAKWAAWWGAGSAIDPRPGGRALIVHPGGIEVSGEVLEVESPERLVFTYGFASGTPFPPGGSRVTIRLQPHAEGTQLHLTHEFPSQAEGEDHVQGWRFQLSLFANLVAAEVNRDVEAQVDAWFAAWSSDDPTARRDSLRRIARDDVGFNDRFSHTEGLDDLATHLDAARRFMPGLTLTRAGAVRQCQGCAISDWSAAGADGQQKGRGTNVFTFDASGRIAAVTGFWARGTSFAPSHNRSNAMKNEQVGRGSSACETNPDSAECARELSQERMVNKDRADHKRAEYLQRHDDDEAELELPR